MDKDRLLALAEEWIRDSSNAMGQGPVDWDLNDDGSIHVIEDEYDSYDVPLKQWAPPEVWKNK